MQHLSNEMRWPMIHVHLSGNLQKGTHSTQNQIWRSWINWANWTPTGTKKMPPRRVVSSSSCEMATNAHQRPSVRARARVRAVVRVRRVDGRVMSSGHTPHGGPKIVRSSGREHLEAQPILGRPRDHRGRLQQTDGQVHRSL